ncbi:MAG: exodeoxyribonuclease VII small subunit [Pseudomonadota bacterium]
MPKTKKNAAFDFEKGLIELEKIVEQMEQGNSTLEVSLEQFGQAIHLLKNCQVTLKKAEQRVQILLNKDEKDILMPFEVNEELV